MALNDAAVLVIGAGNYLTAPVGTSKPADLKAPADPWENVGHTSLENILSLSSEGGDSSVIATLQNKALRTKYSPRTETLTFNLHQFDTAGLKLFYGANAPVLADGSVGVPSDPQPTICAFCAIFIDGENVFALYAPKAEIYRADDMSADDTESPAILPLAVKPMQHETNTWTYSVTPLGEVSAPVNPLV